MDAPNRFGLFGLRGYDEPPTRPTTPADVLAAVKTGGWYEDRIRDAPDAEGAEGWRRHWASSIHSSTGTAPCPERPEQRVSPACSTDGKGIRLGWPDGSVVIVRWPDIMRAIRGHWTAPRGPVDLDAEGGPGAKPGARRPERPAEPAPLDLFAAQEPPDPACAGDGACPNCGDVDPDPFTDLDDPCRSCDATPAEPFPGPALPKTPDAPPTAATAPVGAPLTLF